ncbi:hypothetical protein ACMYR3_06245 [Ampullimonas aquatilis]|uniref:hypothetical protein n=1 Tax=Ampullimonas aquatilis TaxID=1341549 RepID=UPI003C71BAD4
MQNFKNKDNQYWAFNDDVIVQESADQLIFTTSAGDPIDTPADLVRCDAPDPVVISPARLRQLAIESELSVLDVKSLRPLRDGDQPRLDEIKGEIDKLRAEWRELDRVIKAA